MSDLIRQTMATIDRHGWAIIVHPDENGLLHGYTVGLTFFRVPELHATAMRPEKLHETLDVLARQQSTLGPFAAGETSTAADLKVQFEAKPDFSCMKLVQVLFGDNDPVPPTALEVVVLPEIMISRVGEDGAGLLDAVHAVTPLKDGCPNTPNCGHIGYTHDIWDEGDQLPMCGAPGCTCGKPPAGWERTLPNQYWHRGDTIPAGVYVQALDGTVHQAAEAWENTDFEWLVEIEEIGSAR